MQKGAEPGGATEACNDRVGDPSAQKETNPFEANASGAREAEMVTTMAYIAFRLFHFPCIQNPFVKRQVICETGH
jgi:hypothetical protein